MVTPPALQFGRRDRPFRVALAAVALAAGVAVFFVGTELFPHLSSNHDEGVYLQQAELLLDGQLAMYSPIPEAVHPWFFVQDGARLYPKYTPVAAALFAPGVAVGVPRLVPALIAVANVALLGLLVREGFGRSTAVVAAVLLAASPLFLLNGALFLSYAPTTALNLCFALAYVRATRAEGGRRRRYALLAGTAIGVAFWARPFTAVLFALPFVGHALATLVRTGWSAEQYDPRSLLAAPAVERSLLVAVPGLAFVGIALSYNHVVTGSALVFPYQAFAPQDGPGFGVRSILGYERHYTPALALETNALVLWRLATRWTVAPPLGTLAAGLGLGVTAARLRGRVSLPAVDGLSDHGIRLLLAGVALSVAVGNVFFWGNLNLLAALGDPTDGLISLIGPFYHFDLLAPLSAFGAFGLVVAWRRLRAAVSTYTGPRGARVALAAVLLVGVAGGAVAQADALAGPVERNEPYTERYERAYAPFENRTFERAVVFVPDPYGDWLNHPFQSLRNDPDFDGPALYAIDEDAATRFAVLDTYPDRQPYRYVVRGEWTPEVNERDPVDATVEPLAVRSAERFRVETTVGVVGTAESATVRLSGPEGAINYGVTNVSGETTTVEWLVERGRARATGDGLESYSEQRWITYRDADELALAVTYTQPGGSTVTYRQQLSVETTTDEVRVLWPPKTTICRLVADCGTAGAYVPGSDDYVTGVSLNTTLSPADHSP
ncbi:ArnT family glycosyltransferase [Halorientalis marina]|uniref:ArnT family glycosyltransferase n=1 Tax=Halorientalis marina TaxID=2931976 RepID=UPI001FF402D3|nr:glycosyltransferase family 39 protein [Halorientalis marina]